MTKKWSDYIDENGIMGHRLEDGRLEFGDGAQRTGMLLIGKLFSPPTFAPSPGNTVILDYLEIEPGVYVRHRKSTEAWHSDPGEFSRDQQTPLVIAMGLYGDKSRLWRLFRKHMFRLGKYQNADVMGPTHFSYYLRAFGWSWSYPILLLTDLAMVIGVLIRCWQASRDKDDVGDDLNQILALLQAKLSLPTPLSELARKLYVKLRPHNYGSSETIHPIQGALNWYFRHPGAPPMDELYRPVIDKYFLGVRSEDL